MSSFISEKQVAKAKKVVAKAVVPAQARVERKFEDEWVFPSIIKTQLGASNYETSDMVDSEGCIMKFNTGRVIKITRFYSPNGNEIPSSERKSMELVSKKTGRPYVVCKA
jgi:hypothetical protein